MDIPNLRQHFLSDNLKILRRPTPKQDNSPYLPILLKVMMVEERITFAVHLKVSEGEEGEIRYLPYLEEGEILQRSWVESLERVGIERLFFHEQDLDRAVAYLNNHVLLTSAEPKHYKEKFCILRGTFPESGPGLREPSARGQRQVGQEVPGKPGQIYGEERTSAGSWSGICSTGTTRYITTR